VRVVELLNKLKEENEAVIINGIVGKITEVGEEMITLETMRKKDKDKVRETIYIPINHIATISKGEKVIPKSEEEKKIEDDLKSL